MSRELGRLEVTIDCDNCGITQGHPCGENLNRCVECGQFASDDTSHLCCTLHELRSSPYPSGECPYCEEERRIEAERQHMMTRDPQVEPW